MTDLTDFQIHQLTSAASKCYELNHILEAIAELSEPDPADAVTSFNMGKAAKRINDLSNEIYEAVECIAEFLGGKDD